MEEKPKEKIGLVEIALILVLVVVVVICVLALLGPQTQVLFDGFVNFVKGLFGG